MAEVGTAFVTIVPSARGFGAKLNAQTGPAATSAGTSGGKQYGGAFKGAVGSALKGLGGVIAGVGIAKAFGFITSEASDLSESVNAVNVSYGKNAKAILAIGQNSAKGFGLSKSEFNGFAVQFQSFSKTIAGAGGDIPKTFESIIGRARDFASVMNLDVGQAAELFQSGLAGETEPLRKFGIDLSAAAVQAFAYANGIAKAGKPLTEQQKVQARYALLMKQTAKTQGDFKNTSDGFANSQRILSAQFKNVAATIGSFVIPALATFFTILSTKVGPALRSIGTFIGNNATTFKIIAGVIGALLVPSLIVATATLLANTVAWIANGAAMAVATVWIRAYQIGAKIAAAAQWLLNAAMLANPFVLIVAAIILLVAAIVLLWKKSETFRTIIKGLWSAIQTAFTTGINFVKRHWKAFFVALLTLMGGPIGLLVGLFVTNLDKIVGFFKKLPGRIKTAIGDVGKFLLQKGKDLVQGFINGIKAAPGKIKDALLSLLPGPLKKFAGKLGLSSPSKLFKQYGEWTVQGYVDGIRNKRPLVAPAVSSIADAAAGLNATTRGVRPSMGLVGPASNGPLVADIAGAEIAVGKDGLLQFVKGQIIIHDQAGAMHARFG